MENRIAKWLECDPRTDIIEQGLGANDAPRNTHLLHVNADEIWWASLMDKMMEIGHSIAVQSDNYME